MSNNNLETQVKILEEQRKLDEVTKRKRITKERVDEALKNNNGFRALAAKELGCSTKTIYNRLRGM